MEKPALFMGIIRMFSGSIEIIAAILMLHFKTVESAFKINAALALVGPTVLIVVTSIGLIGLADQLPISRFVIIFLGVALIFFGLKGL
ncbi:MAG: YqhV family protein [Bacillota bacterium]|nr:YqhV family protein [Bacillota bacterium]